MNNNSFNAPPQRFGEIPLVQRLFDFYKIFHGYLSKFPKGDKYTLGQNIQSNTLQIVEIIIFCSTEGSSLKREKLKTASAKLDLLRLLIRLAHEVKALDQKGYIKLQELLQEIGKMIGGWLRSLN